ncbi:MAG: type II secretion system protein GspG [Acidobacteria bacterium]|nr:type II secretion system protein GspG [Acidobacteriota bacterium]MBI3426289.1 type II secretion system protein GspG [Acidobacteriota bacterium]
MPNRIHFLLFLAALAVALSCGTRTPTRVPAGTPPASLDVKHIRELLQHVAGADLKPAQVEIKSIAPGTGNDNAVVEARIETAFRLQRENGAWKVAEVRLGDRQWESLDLVEAAVQHEKERRTTGLLQRLAEGLEAYRREKGQFVATEDVSVLLDHLAPRYLGNPLRFDWWGSQFVYHGTPSSYQLLSAGPDRKPGTSDDLVVRSQ